MLQQNLAALRSIIAAYADAIDSHIWDRDDIRDDETRAAYAADKKLVQDATYAIGVIALVVERHHIDDERLAFIRDNEPKLVEAMHLFGGAFARHIAAAWKSAAENDKARLRESFGNMLYTYKQHMKGGA
jgi:hypothetical protein